MHMLCMLSWCVDTQQLGNWDMCELADDILFDETNEYVEDPHSVCWAPCGSILAVTAHSQLSGQLTMWIVSSQAQILHHLTLSYTPEHPEFVWTRDSKPILLDLENSALHVMDTPPRRIELPVTLQDYDVVDDDDVPIRMAADVCMHTSPYLKASECMVLLNLEDSMMLVDCSGAFPLVVCEDTWWCKHDNIACGLTYVAVISPKKPSCMQLFALAFGPVFVPIHEIQLPATTLSVPISSHGVSLAFSPDDSCVALVQPARSRFSGTPLTILSPEPGHDQHPYPYLLQAGKHADVISNPNSATWSGTGTCLSVYTSFCGMYVVHSSLVKIDVQL